MDDFRLSSRKIRKDKGTKRPNLRRDKGIPKQIEADADRTTLIAKLTQVWRSMMYRCHNAGNSAYPSYGGRGIQVCKAWHDRGTFIEWALAHGYRHGMTIERKSNDGWYTAENCVLAGYTPQARNRRSNRTITFRGRTQCLAAWAQELGINASTLWYRLGASSVEEAFGSPKPKPLGLTFNGETKTLPEWAAGIGIHSTTISHRLASGWTVEEALSNGNRIGWRRDLI